MPKYLLTIFFIVFSKLLNAQHSPLYSLYMFNGLAINPALAGGDKALSAMIHYKDQWSEIEGHPATYTLIIDSPLKIKKYSLGGKISFDKFGISSNTDYTQSFAYRPYISNSSELSLGVQAGITYQTMDWFQVNATPDDGVFSGNPASNIVPKLGFGVNYKWRQLYIGASMPHIALNPVNDNALQIYKTPVYYFTSGYNYSLNNNFNVKPSFLIKYLQFSNMQVDINTMVNYKNIISVGASYRTGNAIMLLTEIKYHHLKFGYAYDYYLNSLKKVSNGSHELMFKYEFHYLVKVIDPRNFY